MSKSELIKKITTSGILLAIIVVMQLLKNVIPAMASGSIINATMAVATITLGIWWGVGFSIIVPVLSILTAFASPMTALTISTYGLNIPIIALGNIILVLMAYFGYKLFHMNKRYASLPLRIIFFVICLVFGAITKWLFMWGSSIWIIEPIFKNSLDKKQMTVLNNLFSLTQLVAGLISVPLTFFVELTLDKIYHRE